MTRFRLSRLLAAALLACAFVAGGARAEQMSITGQAGSPLTTTDGVRSVPSTTSQQFGPGFRVTPGSAGVAVIGLGPLPTSCAGLQPGTPFNNGTSTAGVCQASGYLLTESGGHIALNSGGALLLNQ